MSGPARVPRPRRPWVAGLLSVLAPGMGHLHAGRPRQAVLILLAILIWMTAWIAISMRAGHPAARLLSLAVAIGVVVPVAAHAVRAASYFLLGDNRHLSYDSRYFGFVHRERLVGRPVWIYASRAPAGGWRMGRVGRAVR